MEIVGLVALILWLIVFCYLNVGLKEGKKSEIGGDAPGGELSVLIVMRDEADRIEACLASIAAQDHISKPIRCVVVDDHSSDDSMSRVIQMNERHEGLEVEVVSSRGAGKKAGLRHGLELIPSGKVFLTDADCELGPKVLARALHELQSNHEAVFGPIAFTASTFLERIIRYENFNTQCVTESLLHRCKPLMVNGGNMLLNETGKQKFLATLENGMVSGDDVLFAQSLRVSEYGTIYNADALVFTKPPSNLFAFWQQRIRWAKKYRGYQSAFNLIFPAALFLINLGFVCVHVAWALSGFAVLTFPVILVSKFLLEFGFHSAWFARYRYTPKLHEALLLSLIYPWYYIAIGLASQLGKGYVWKGRQIRSA